MSRAASLPGQNFFFPENRFFLKKPLVPGSFAAWGRIVSRKSFLFEETTCPGQLRCLGQNFVLPENRCVFEETTCPGQLRCLGQMCFTENRVFLKKPLLPGSFAAWGRTFSRKSMFFEEATCPGQLRCLGQNFSQKKMGESGILGLLCAEQDVDNLNKWTFRNYEAPVRRTKRRKST